MPKAKALISLTAVLLATAPVCASAASGRETAGAARRPNIVLIMCDDMGFSDIGCYGGEVRTPHIDRLAREGMRFTQFYNNAKCTTTRVSLLTGLYPRRKGPLLKDNMVTIAEVLGGAGYRTALSGKWHLGRNAPRRPGERGFDRYFGLLDGCCNFFDPSIPDPAFKGGRVRYVAKDDVRITEFPDGFYMTDAISDYAVECVDDFAKTKMPFFLHVCYTAPHYPLHAKPEDIARYRGRYLHGWEQLRRDRHGRQIEMGLIDPQWRLPPPDPEVTPWKDAPHKKWQDLRMAVYAAMIDSMDQGIGRILKKLEQTGTLENTVVMFLSDNGGCAEIPGGEDPRRIPGPGEYYTTCGPGWAYAQNTPFRRYKSWVHEGGISTPLVVRWPGVVAEGAVCRDVAHIIDLLPTCAEIGGASYPANRERGPGSAQVSRPRRNNRRQVPRQPADSAGIAVLPCEGLSMLPLLKGGSRKGHKELYWEWAGNRAIRAGRWKLCWDRKIRCWELYDIVRDRTETHDLASRHPQRVREMSEKWLAWARRTGH